MKQPESSAAAAACDAASRKPAISIGLPVYNGEEYLRIALDALLQQTFTDFEVIICDNASTDATWQISEEYAARDGRIRCYRNPRNIGAAANYRRAFELSFGEYFKWNAVDDVMAPEYLEKCKAVLDTDPGVVLCCSKVNMIDAQGKIIEKYPDVQELQQPSPVARFRQKFLQDRRNNTAFALIRSAIIRKTRSIRDFIGSDNVFTEELSLYGRFHEIPEYLFFRRNHPKAFSHTPSLERVREFYSPGKKGARRFALVVSRHLFEYARIMLKVPLPLRERARLLSFLLRFAWWKKRTIAREVMVALKPPASH